MNKRQRYYRNRKLRLRCEAIEWQFQFEAGEVLYWSDLAEATERFTRLGKQYGMLRELRENGII